MSNRNKKWSTDEDKLLKENLKDRSYIEIAQILNRTLSAIENRVRALGIARTTKRWTEHEKNFLKENYAKFTVAELTKKLDRGANGIQYQAVRLGLNKRITEKQRQEVLEKAKSTDFTNEVIARETNMSEGSVNRILRQHQIKRKRGAKSTNTLLKGFVYNGNGRASVHRHAMLYVYHNTCWDCKKTFVNGSDLQIHHDLTQVPVRVYVLCKKCHGKRHGRNFRFGTRTN